MFPESELTSDSVGPTNTVPSPFLAPPCGSCSNFACRTSSVGAVCGTDPGSHLPLHCYDEGLSCSPDGLADCICELHQR